MNKLTSEYIEEMRSIPGGENIPNIYQAHMSAIDTERKLKHARKLVHELFSILEGSVEGPSIDHIREWELKGLLTLWGFYPSKEMNEET